MEAELNTTTPANHGARTAVEQSRSMAEVQAAVIMARRFPRDQVQSTERIRVACQREGLAKTATYQYARGGSNVVGPSIRLAETMAQMWGNLQYGIHELANTGKASTMEAYCWDMETNVRVSKTFEVSHTRHTKNGSYDLTDPRDVYENNANMGARRLRACILGIIPGDVVEMAVDECDNTLRASVALTDKKIKAIIAAFAKHDVTQAMIEERLQRKASAMTPGQYLDLTKIGTSLNDGMSKVEDWFRVPSARPMDVRLSPAQMASAKEEVEMGVATPEEILQRFPNIVADQQDEIRTWGPKDYSESDEHETSQEDGPVRAE